LRGNAHETLRSQTQHLHEALDASLVLSNLACRGGYIDYLVLNWACVPIEEALERAGIGQVLPDWLRRRRFASLVADLKELGVAAPTHTDLTIDSDIGSLLGWSYVLEGSRLGARVILQAVMSNQDAGIRSATEFLRHGEGEPFWQTFKVTLGKIDSDPAAVTRACTGANAAFQCFVTPSRLLKNSFGAPKSSGLRKNDSRTSSQAQ
jgi:heme oxygenase